MRTGFVMSWGCDEGVTNPGTERFVSGCRNSFGALCESTASIDSMERITTWRVYMQNSHNTNFLCGAHLKFTAENAWSVVLVAGETSSEPRSLELISFA